LQSRGSEATHHQPCLTDPFLLNKAPKREGIGEIRSAVCLALAGSASTTYLLKEAAATAIFKNIFNKSKTRKQGS